MIRNKKTSLWKLGLALLSILFLVACQPEPDQGPVDDGRLQVTVSILPQAYFVERIGGDFVAVNVMVGPGEDPHTYEPKPDQMRALSHSQLFFTIGTEYEDAWMPRLREANPEITFVDSAAGIQRIPLTSPHDHPDQETDPEKTNHSGEKGLDPHVWLAPANGKIIASNIFKALQALQPEHADAFQSNYDALLADIMALDEKIEGLLSGNMGNAFVVFHPAWGYFANQYKLEQIPVQVGGQEPSASDLAALISTSRQKNIRAIFIQPTYSTAIAQAIAAEINAEIAIVDPLAHDWLTNLEGVAEAFAAALEK
ncbi:MAG TPA: zinc ABC transporter substrate-binding protein [Brevefilum sp.]|nr:zinc ABC transporter substrate-binding protein [Brevefilum sp.]HOR19306.1 zinc ABC transporter substrate-binding protein [Brevefilum sp.]HPL69911.1 zinc ABC transporter substrate-binding protein [Brevefilum sp.]